MISFELHKILFIFNSAVANRLLCPSILFSIVIHELHSHILSLTFQFKDIGKSWHRSIEQYLFSIWNLLDVFAIVTFFVGLLSSYIGRQSSKVNIGFISFVVSSFLRILQFLGMIPALGLYVVMIRKMVCSCLNVTLFAIVSWLALWSQCDTMCDIYKIP